MDREYIGDCITHYGVIPCLFCGVLYWPFLVGAAALAIIVMFVNPDSVNPFP